ncbi:hypothetical protein AKJ38_02610 [candidate division MSBL1 archaeon SCGC-AAA259I14]|uniref:Uncharacterized protein n=1 Tax=candidate division MSBL1 archaeon SCGC-AAA259I14 TaxID=1698268 RepID=A0A133URK8_9EURY|nr:hypothetical protein AKJ38_02610 [candidate division MSBL1 archaeon SCGC-AAA259I14]
MPKLEPVEVGEEDAQDPEVTAPDSPELGRKILAGRRHRKVGKPNKLVPKELDKWVERAEDRDFPMAANYMRKVKEKLLTFAKAALKSEYVSYTNNKEGREF